MVPSCYCRQQRGLDMSLLLLSRLQVLSFSLININLTESRFKVISKYSFFYSKAFALQDRLIRALIQTTLVLYGQAKRAISTG